jgi:Fungal Zn(2)-Cys(6) binuclear cluster domain/Fungal specific transcription factor domain
MKYSLLIYNSDSLLRHLAKHGNVFKPNPSGRSKRACITCHAGKIKCDGNEKCSTCLKKGLECKYRAQDEIQSLGPPIERGEQVDCQTSTSAKEQEPHSRSNVTSESIKHNIPHESESGETQAGATTRNGTSQDLRLTSSSIFQAPKASGLVDWSAVQIRTDSHAQDSPPTLNAAQEGQPNPDSEKYMELYYLHFHHRWPILHRPSLEEETPISIVLSSMDMIGAWLDGSLEAKKFALDSHEKLVKDIMSQLVRARAITPCTPLHYFTREFSIPFLFNVPVYLHTT